LGDFCHGANMIGVSDETKRRSKKSRVEHGASLRTAFKEVRELIVHGKLSPGTWIVEADLAQRLGMSRTPVRGAIHWLQREGYVIEHTGVSKSRMVVAPLTKEDAAELYSIIGIVEGLAGRRTAMLPKPERTAMAAKLKQVNQHLNEIVQNRPAQAGGIFDLDREFHRIIVESGAGSRLMTIHKAIEPQAERYWRLYASSIINDLHLSVAEHEVIIKGIVSGDADKVESGLRTNWGNGANRLARVIDVFGERGSW
jgi:DNA-binding GntR family transcriptional regulator